jgi:2-oxoglutarate ferredoxin oxidoreductase subunit alpha
MINFFSHGDTKQIMLFPGSVNECFEFGWRAFDLAERLQTPIFVMTDLDLGMNTWMTKPFSYPDTPMDRGKVLWEKDIDRLKGEWGRYRDIDGDGIPYRTIPGNRHPQAAWFARGTGHNENARYSEDPVIWEKNMMRLNTKYETARNLVPVPVIETQSGAKVGIIAYGSTDLAIQEARAELSKQDIPTDYLRLRSIPFTEEVFAFLRSHETVYVVEMNRDGQVKQLLSIDAPCEACRLFSVAHIDGLPLTAHWIVDQIVSYEEKGR